MNSASLQGVSAQIVAREQGGFDPATLRLIGIILDETKTKEMAEGESCWLEVLPCIH